MDLMSEILSLSDRDGCGIGVEEKYDVDKYYRKFLKFEDQYSKI